ncbi:MAG: ABC transporter ATP-binding protein [Treponema sp.]|jgi:peptide/nickel transport system ATP-binding protein|nr:ABC transporter ATP-binding protein [Treponema sp.]
MEETLFRAENLSVSFQRYEQRALEHAELRVISDLSLDAREGEIVAVAGASGSGKSLLAHAIMGILPPNASVSGGLYYRGEALDEKRQARLRGREIALIPQSVSFLDPLMRVGVQVAGVKKRNAARQEVFGRLGLSSEVERLYPFQLSGGMARRALVATAIIAGAQLIIADEPTPGMDTRIALEALRCFRELADEGKSVILITHDIDLAMGIADRLAVFYAGTSVELADAQDFIAGAYALRHPYTKALWKALPQNGFEPIAGFQPYAGDVSTSAALAGCLFAPRCPLKSAECESAVPPMQELRGGQVRCIHAS